jgi:transposase
MDIISQLNNNIQKTYKEEKTEYYKGERSLRSYRSSIPMPFSSSNITFTQQEKSKNFNFSIYKIPFSTCLGADKSGNEIIINRIVAGEYKFCNSSFQWNKKKNKWFLLLCVDMPKIKLLAKEGVVVEADLNMFVPIIATCNGKGKEIGNSDEFGYNRIAIQNKLNSLQKDLKYTTGGKGRTKKLQAVERFKEKEKNYVKTKLHIYSRMLVNFAIDMKAESIRLVNHELKVEDSKENAPLLLRNWSYYGLQQMIEYKAKQVGIELLIN